MVSVTPEALGHSPQDLTEAERVLTEVTNTLLKSPLKSVRDVIHRTGVLVNHLPLTIRAGSISPPDFVTQLSFIPDGRYHEPHEVSETSWPVYAEKISPTIIFDTSGILGSDRTRIQADVIRTSTVAAGWLDQGYQSRLRQVYGQALTLQERWLRRMKADSIPADPRGADQRDKNTTIYNSIGKWHFMGDTGFKDWQRGVDWWLRLADRGSRVKLQKGQERKQSLLLELEEPLCEELFYEISREGDGNEAIRRYLHDIRSHVGHFVVARYARVPFILNAIRHVPELKQLVVQQEKMARTMGILLVQDSLLRFVLDRRLERTRKARWRIYDLEAPYFNEDGELTVGES